jgi:multidrug resistance efflux pump
LAVESTRPHETTRDVVRVTACPDVPSRTAPPTKFGWRRLLVAAGLGVILLVVSAFVVVGPMRSGWSSAASDSDSTHLGPRPSGTPTVVCLGTADVRGGVVRLLPTVPGRVLAVHVDDNADVSAGQVLLTLDDRQARSQLREAEAALQAAESQCHEARKGPEQHKLVLAQQKAALAALRHELAAAHLAAAHKRKLMEAKQLSREEADAAVEVEHKLKSLEQVEAAKLEALELRDPLQDLARAEAEVRAKAAMRDRVRDALGEYALKAPTAGRVLRVLANPGDLVGPGQTNEALLFCPAGPRVVRAEVEQEYAGRVEIGQHAAIEDAARSGGPTWNGKVVRIADWFTHRRIVTPDQIPVQEVRTLECLVELDANQPPLRIGQRVRVRLYAQ